jgi:dihydroorotate dehydrogenase electron transfer subunit
VLPALIVKNNIDVVYSCGPMAMLEAITKITQDADVVHQCSVEESMACGIGVCMTCVLPFEGEDGVVRMTRTCVDGPVMDGNKVLWNRTREVPDGVWGK